jgi:plastocyanin
MVEVEEQVGPPRGLLLGLGLIGLVVGGAIAGEFVLRVQPALSSGGAVAGGVIMPVGVGSNTALNFSPSTIVVVIGVNNTVTFTNKDSVTHTVTATDNSFNSGDIKAGQSWTNTFTTPGTFTFYCIYHHWMLGSIVVESAGSNATTSISSTNSTST